MPSDEELRDQLRQIDEDEDIDVTNWEAEFIETVVYRQHRPLTDKQISVAQKIVDRYL